MKRVYPKLIIIVALLSLACTTKVSEWVLLNAVPDQYMLVYFHRTELSEIEKKQNAGIETRLKLANITFKSVQRNEVEKTYYALYFNNRLLAEYANEKEILNIANSPTREKIANQLMSGKLCVMLYLKSGNEEKDKEGLEVVKKSVAASPFAGIITVFELDRESVAERPFVSMLLNVESDLKEIKEPMVFGIFGRFRALEPLLAKGITQENINFMIDFLTADCSCLIKDNLPGTSILYSGSWENPQPALVNKILDENPNLEHH